MTKSLKVQGFARSDGPIGGFVNGKRLTIDKNQGSPPSIKTGKGYSPVKKLEE